MQTGPRRTVVLLLVLVAACSQTYTLAQTLNSERPVGIEDYVWLDANGKPLPSQDHTAIMALMQSATIIDREMVGRGIAGVEKLSLDADGLRFHAAHRTINVSKRSRVAGSSPKRPKKYRDAAIFEAAAYQLSELLGMGRVPPAIEVRIGEQNDTLQIWMEHTTPEDVLIQNDELNPPDARHWNQQKQIMVAFDNLIANSDRNQGNILIDRGWNLWFIDHSRSFRWTSKLIYRNKQTACERGFWRSLREIDEDTIRERLEPYLTSRELSTLLRRRLKLIDHIQELIDKNGEDAVLFDLRAPE